MKSECQAYSVKTRVRRRNAGSAAGVEVLGEQRLALGVGDEIGEQGVEMLAPHRIVVVPPDDALGLGVADDELVLRAASGMHAGVGDQRPMRGDKRFVALQRLLIKLRRAEVPVDRGKIAEAEPFRAEVGVARPILDHPELFPRGAPERARQSTSVKQISPRAVNPAKSGAAAAGVA